MSQHDEAEHHEPDEFWGSFPGIIEGLPALFSVDLSWADSGGDPERPTLVVISTPFKDPDENGMPAPEEFEAVMALEPVLDAALADPGPALIATMLGNGARHWCMYAPNDAFVAPLIARMKAAAPEYKPDARVEDDPEWRFYLDTLYPNEEQYLYVQDSLVVSTLVEAGDVSEAERPIEHFAYFRKARDRDKFRDWCAQEGFTIDEDLAPTKDSPAYGLRFHHVGPAIADMIWEKTLQITEAAAGCGGEYDGWDCAIVKADNP